MGRQRLRPGLGAAVRQRQRPGVDRARWPPTTPAPTAAALYLKSCASCHRDDRRGTPPQIPALTNLTASAEQLTTVIRQGAGRMPGFPHLSPEAVRTLVAYLRDTPGHGETAAAARPPAAARARERLRFTGYKKFLDPDGYPAVAPPWGTLSAIDLNTGAYAWKIPLGEYPELVAQGLTEHRLGELRRADRHRRRRAVHRRHQLRPQVPRLRRRHRAAAVAGDAAVRRQHHAGDLRGRRPPVRRRRRGWGSIDLTLGRRLRSFALPQQR